MEIDPPSLCPIPANAQVYKTLERKIDFAIGLRLEPAQRDALEQGLYVDDHALPSINQTSSFTRYTPMFLNIEIKKVNSGVDPLVQLAVWVTAEYNKRVIEGYDRSMPAVALAIVGHEWELYLAYDPYPKSTTLLEMVRRSFPVAYIR